MTALQVVLIVLVTFYSIFGLLGAVIVVELDVAPWRKFLAVLAAGPLTWAVYSMFGLVYLIFVFFALIAGADL